MNQWDIKMNMTIEIINAAMIILNNNNSNINISKVILIRTWNNPSTKSLNNFKRTIRIKMSSNENRGVSRAKINNSSHIKMCHSQNKIIIFKTVLNNPWEILCNTNRRLLLSTIIILTPLDSNKIISIS
jgi:hypothetical protein